MNGTNRAAVALVSFPGSGNTWVRGVLEQATGVCTGKVCSVFGEWKVRSTFAVKLREMIAYASHLTGTILL